MCHFGLPLSSLCLPWIVPVQTGKYQTIHSRSQNLDFQILLRRCFQKAIFSPVLFSVHYTVQVVLTKQL